MNKTLLKHLSLVSMLTLCIHPLLGYEDFNQNLSSDNINIPSSFRRQQQPQAPLGTSYLLQGPEGGGMKRQRERDSVGNLQNLGAGPAASAPITTQNDHYKEVAETLLRILTMPRAITMIHFHEEMLNQTDGYIPSEIFRYIVIKTAILLRRERYIYTKFYTEQLDPREAHGFRRGVGLDRLEKAYNDYVNQKRIRLCIDGQFVTGANFLRLNLTSLRTLRVTSSLKDGKKTIGILSEYMDYLTKLTGLYLTYRPPIIPRNMVLLTNLTKLKIDECYHGDGSRHDDNIDTFPFGSLQKLKKLSLWTVEFGSFPVSIRQLTSLTSLKIINILPDLDESEEELSSEEEMLQAKIPDWLGELSNLTDSSYCMWYNSCSTSYYALYIPDTFRNLTNLTKLNINTTYLEDLPERLRFEHREPRKLLEFYKEKQRIKEDGPHKMFLLDAAFGALDVAKYISMQTYPMEMDSLYGTEMEICEDS